MKNRRAMFILLFLPFIVVFSNAQMSVAGNAERVFGSFNDCAKETGSAGSVSHAESTPKDCYQAAPGSSVGTRFDKPSAALGAPDAVAESSGYVSLGNAQNSGGESNPRECEAYLIVSFDTMFITDGPGADVKIYESGTNSGSGIAEVVDVFVSVDDESWFYLGRTAQALDTLDLAEVVTQAQSNKFRYVGICDYADGNTTGKTSPGPDIDAVEALYPQYEHEVPAYVAKSEGKENKINDKPVPDGGTNRLNEGDQVELGEKGEVDILKYCPDLIAELVHIAEELGQEGDLQGLHNVIKMIKAAEELCANAPDSAVSTNRLDFEMLEGSIRFQVTEDLQTFGLKTETAVVEADNGTIFSVVHDPAKQESRINALQGSAHIIPENTQFEPFRLDSGYSVIIKPDSVSDIFAEAQVYLPGILGETGSMN